MPRDLAERFWSHVWCCDHRACSQCCWLWKPSVIKALRWSDTAGYRLSKLATEHGQFIIRKGAYYSAHRFAYILVHGALLLPFSCFEVHICHRCDIGPCCNPKHLFIGTVGDNNRDRKAKWAQRFIATIRLPNGQRMSRMQPLTEALCEGIGPLKRLLAVS